MIHTCEFLFPHESRRPNACGIDYVYEKREDFFFVFCQAVGNIGGSKYVQKRVPVPRRGHPWPSTTRTLTAEPIRPARQGRMSRGPSCCFLPIASFFLLVLAGEASVRHARFHGRRDRKATRGKGGRGCHPWACAFGAHTASRRPYG